MDAGYRVRTPDADGPSVKSPGHAQTALSLPQPSQATAYSPRMANPCGRAVLDVRRAPSRSSIVRDVAVPFANLIAQPFTGYVNKADVPIQDETQFLDNFYVRWISNSHNEAIRCFRYGKDKELACNRSRNQFGHMRRNFDVVGKINGCEVLWHPRSIEDWSDITGLREPKKVAAMWARCI